MDFVSKCGEILRRHALDQFGFSTLQRPLTIDLYRDWIAKGYHAGMNYLSDHASVKEDPQRLAPKARSAIMVAKNYLPHPYPAQTQLKLRTALYAHGSDYHSSFRRELESVAHELRSLFPEDEFLCFTDSAPILERDLAYRAGLGWVGKNTCLINPQRGSLFFIGEILTSRLIDTNLPPVPDMCGSCDRCLRACPTQALEPGRLLNANKCIAYWTIEARSSAPPEMLVQFNDWFFGCDICQTVCPWNEKTFGRTQMQQLSQKTQDQDLTDDLRWILSSSRKQLARAFADSPLSRARPYGLKRNAIVVIGNLKLKELRPEVAKCREEPDLKEVADWTLAQLL